MKQVLLGLMLAVGMHAQAVFPPGGDGVGNQSASSVGAVTSLEINITPLRLAAANVSKGLLQCWTGTGPYTPVTITNYSITGDPATAVTPTFSSTANITCRFNSSGATGPTGAAGATGATGPAGADGIFSAVASQAEAEAGTENTKGMTALRTAEAIAALAGSSTVDPASVKSAIYCLAASGSGTTYTCSTTNTSSLTTGQVYLFGIDTTNVGDVTLNINSTGAKSVLHKDGDQFAAGDLVAGDVLPVIYDGTQYVPLFEILSNNPGALKMLCGTAPGTPASNYLVTYCNSDTIYMKNDGGTVFAPPKAGGLNTKFIVHDTGGDDAYVASPTDGSCPAALVDGETTVELVVDTTNTDDASLNFCGLGALEISEDSTGTNLTSGDLVVGRVWTLVYDDQATDVWRVTLPGAGGGSGGGVVRVAYASLPACSGANTNTLYSFTDGAGVTAQCDGSSYVYFYNGVVASLVPAASNWTAVGATNTPTLTDKAGTVVASRTLLSDMTWGSMLQAVPGSTPYTITAGFKMAAIASGTTIACGLAVANGTATSSGLEIFELYSDRTNIPPYLRVIYYSAYDTFSSVPFGGVQAQVVGDVVWMRYTDNSTNRLFYISTAGPEGPWRQVLSESRTAQLTATHIGIACGGQGTDGWYESQLLSWKVE